MAEFRITVIVDPTQAERGNRRVRGGLQRTQNAADRLQASIQRALAFAGLAQGVRELIRLSDAFTNIQNRLRTVTTGTEQLNRATSELFRIAQDTRSSFEATAELYARVGLAARNLGRDQEELLAFTESVNQAIILSGASATEANAGLIQLSQGLASGALRGDELRSVLEQLPVVADVIADSLGVTRGELRRLGEDGRITAQIVLDAFRDARAELAERFAVTVPTISQSFVVLRNSAIVAVAALDEATGASRLFSESLLLLADSFNLLIRLIVAAGLTLGTAFVAQGVIRAIAAINALDLVIAANPFGALAIAVTAATAAILAFSDQIVVSSDGSTTLADVVRQAFSDILSSIGNATRELRGFNDEVQRANDAVTDLNEAAQGPTAFERTLLFLARLADRVLALSELIVRTFAAAVDRIAEDIERSLTNAFNSFLFDAGVQLNRLIRTANEFSRRTGIGPELETFDLVGIAGRRRIPDPVTTIGEELAAIRDEIFARVRGGPGVLERQVSSLFARAAIEPPAPEAPPREAAAPGDPLAELVRRLEEEAELLRLGNREREIRTELLALEGDLGRELTIAEQARLRPLIETNRALAEQNDLLRDFEDPIDSLLNRIVLLNDLFDANRISVEEYERAVRDVNRAIDALDESVAGQLTESFRRFADQAQGLGTIIANVLQQTFQMAVQAATDAAVEGFLRLGAAIRGVDREVENLGDVFRSFARAVLQQLLRIIIQLGVAAVVAGILAVLTGGGSTAFGSAFSALSGLSLQGFQDGGRFMVGGRGGPDSEVVAFRATPGELVTVETPQQQRERAISTVVVPPPQVSVTPVLAIDSAELRESVLAGPEAERRIIQVVSENSDVLRTS